MEVEQAVDGAPLRPGRVLLAPGDAHMEVAIGGYGGGGHPRRVVKLHQGPPLHSCKPSVDYLFHSAARVSGGSAVGVIMTGMGSDGLDGARALREAGGLVIAQDQATAAVWGMPGRVVEAGLANATVPLGSLAETLLGLFEAGASAPPNLPAEIALGRNQERMALHGML